MTKKSLTYIEIILAVFLVVALGSSIYLYIQKTNKEEIIVALLGDKQNLEVANNEKTQSLLEANATIEALQNTLNLTEEELNDLESDYRKEKRKNDNFEDQINKIAGTVGKLDKLSKTDEELLQKYSKVYFLNENYIPESLTAIEKKYLYNEDNPKFIHKKVKPFFEKMVEAALDDDINLWVVSAYRSFSEQTVVKNGYRTQYGSGANTFSADQGYSEHQLGTTIDFTTNDLNGGLNGFDSTPAYKWLLKNARKYGFVLSYPKDNTFYQFEPWHWRFVGKDLADDLKDDNANFYDWDQRKIDEYLIKIFD